MPDTPSTAHPADGLPPSEQIIDLQIERELQDSYLTYAMSTIVDRALPDVRDGLKPSQRRILVAMNDLNLSPGRKHSKCAGIVGETMKKYHPHGDAAIYPTLVNLAQEWKTRYLLIDKQGNFGSIDGDPPAAMRYTEARLHHHAMEMLEDLKLDTVDYQANFDEQYPEPRILPSKFPNLLVNGSTGIAVGMACSIPPHNLGEVCRAIEAVIERPDIRLEELMEIVPGPDFPTGGVICGRGGIRLAYATGRGRISVRGVLHVEERAGGRQQLVVDAIPYHVVQGAVMDKIGEAVKSERIKDIVAVRNESGRKSRTRIVIELRKGADPAVVEKQLFQFTPLQQTFSIINIALVNGQPRTLSLREMIDCYIDHRVEVTRRKTAYRLNEARKKAHILEGLIYAVCDLDEVIRLIRSSATREEAIEGLLARRFRIAPDHRYAAQIPAALMEVASRSNGAVLTRVQAEAIGRLQLIQLVGLEIQKLVSDYADLRIEIEGYEAILADHRRVLDIVREDVIEMREKYADDRRTQIEEAADDFMIADLIAEEDMVVTISHEGYVKRLPADTYRQQGRGGRGIKGSETRDADFTEHLFVASTHDDLLCVTNTGRMFRMKVYEIPQMSRTSKGRAIVNLLELREGEKGRAFLAIKNFEAREDYLVFATAQGFVKRTSLKDYRNVHRSGIIATGLRDDDELVNMVLTSGTDHLLLATASGLAIRFSEEDVRVMGRGAQGVKGIALSDGDRVVGMVRADDERDLLTATEKGYGKRTPMMEYLVHQEDGTFRAQGRGGKGRKDIRTNSRNGKAVSILAVSEDDDVIVVTERGMVVRLAASSIRRTGRNAMGVRIAKVNAGDRLVSVARVVESDNGA